MPVVPTEEDLQLDESKVAGENGDVNLFQWLRRAEEALKQLSKDIVLARRSALEATFLKISAGSAPFKIPTRPIRNILGRCLVLLYTRAEARTLYDTLRALIRVVAQPTVPDSDSRVCAFYCIGELMAAFGPQVMSVTADVVSAATRTCKAQANPIILRFHAIACLRKVISAASKAIPDSLSKDAVKVLRQGLTDRALAVQRASADALAAVHANMGFFPLSDIENIVSLCIRGLDTADQPTRRSLAGLVGYLLSSTQTERASNIEPTKKHARKDSDGAQEQATQQDDPTKDSVATLLSPQDMLAQLSAPFNRANTSKKVRIGIAYYYSTLLTTLGPTWVEANYSIIARHILHDVISHPRNQLNRYETLLVRKLMGLLLRDLVGVRMLSEQGQISAIQELSTAYLRKWPALLPGQSAPHPVALVAVLKELSGLLKQLGHVPTPFQNAVSESILRLLGHPNHSTRVAAAWCLHQFCNVAPRRLPKIAQNVIDLLGKDLTSLNLPAVPSEAPPRAVGHAFGLAALFAVFPERPLYVSYDLGVKVLDMAIQVLKRAGEHDLTIARVEVDIAWTLISSLMALGPHFVRPHLSQLLVLWRNALPKPTSKEINGSSERSVTETAFLLFIRQCALGAVLQFLRHNSNELVTLDVARRVGTCLSNALSFVNTLSLRSMEEHPDFVSPLPGLHLTLSALEMMLRHRVLQCYNALGSSTLSDSLQSTLLDSAVAVFSGPDMQGGSSVQAAISASAGHFSSLWSTSDGYAYGISTLATDPADALRGTGEGKQERADTINEDAVEHSIFEQLQRPVIGSCEHDTLALLPSAPGDVRSYWPEPAPANTGVVDAAMDLFVSLLPNQGGDVVTRIWTQVLNNIRSPRMEKNPGRRAAAYLNAVAATLRIYQHPRNGRDSLGGERTSSLLVDMLKDAILDTDLMLRTTGSQAYGHLVSLAGTSFLTAQVKFLVDQVVSNRDPYGRAGCAMTFGAIYSSVGGLAAGPLLKTIVNVLMSLSNDPHPVVHYWALRSLSTVIDAASLSYSPHIPSTLGMLLKLYMAESHEPEGGTLTVSSVRGDLPAYPVMCRIVDSIVAVLGPELQESTRIRTLILDVAQEFSVEDDEGVVVEAIQCLQHCLMFVPEQLDVPDVLRRLKLHLSSTRAPLKLAAVNGLYLLVQKDAILMSQVGGDALAEALFAMLDADPSVEGVRNIISSWLAQTVTNNPSAWIDLCQKIMSQTNASQQLLKTDILDNGFQDEESESLSVGLEGSAPKGADPGARKSTARWRTQLFALQCLHDICMAVSRANLREHVDLQFAKARGLKTEGLLVSRVADLIRMAFTASTAYVTEIRLAGLVILRDVIQMFSNARDPDFQDALLLEQYQAPIAAALTPAFSSETTPEILASAIDVCAIFVGSGIVHEVSKMGRILKLLVTTLSQCSENDTMTIGDATELSRNASVMLRISTIAAWAELASSTVKHGYLQMVINPHRDVLSTLWVASLRDYASSRAYSEIAADSADGTPSALEMSLSTVGRDVTLPYYEANWLKILAAAATFMRAGDPNILAAMDGKDPSSKEADSHLTNGAPSEDCCLLFPAIFGLAFEVLVSNASDSSNASIRDRVVVALKAVQSLVRPEYAGNRILDSAIFDEFCTVMYRLALTGPPPVQLGLLEVITALVVGHRNRLQSQHGLLSDGGGLPDSQLTQCLRICACVLQRAVPSIMSFYSGQLTHERSTLVVVAFETYMSIASLFGQDLQDELRATAVSVYSSMLNDESASNALAGFALTSLKTLLSPNSAESAPGTSTVSPTYNRLVHGLLSNCLQNIEEMGGRQAPSAINKIKNNLLAAVSILTLVSPGTLLSQVAVDQCCFLVSQKLLDETVEISNCAAHCAKFLAAAANGRHPALQHCAVRLLPGMVTYISSISDKDLDDRIQGAEEILKAFAALLALAPQHQVIRALGIVLPCIILLLEPDSPTPPKIHTHCVSQLLFLASSYPTPFKEAAGKLDATDRDTLQASLTQRVAAAAPSVQQAPKRQIALKQFGG